MKILRTFVAYVEDRPGVLNRVVSLFRRRGYNIESLTVGRSLEPGLSRMTVLTHADEDTARRIEAHLYKLVNVIRVQDITYAAAVSRDMALIKVRASPEARTQILELIKDFHGRPVDIAHDALIVEVTGDQAKVDGLIVLLEPFGVLEIVRSGVVAMTRGMEPVGVSRSSEQTKQDKNRSKDQQVVG